MKRAKGGAVCLPTEGFDGDLGGFELMEISFPTNFDPLIDCVIYALCSCLSHFDCIVSSFLISTLRLYLATENHDIFSGGAFTMGRVVSILERYFYASVTTIDCKSLGNDIHFPCICRVGYEGGVGTHVIFIYQKKIWSLDTAPLYGQIVYDCRKIYLEKLE